MSSNKSSTWFGDAPLGWTGIPNFVRDAVKQKQITPLAAMVAWHLCGVADNLTGEVIAQSMSFIAQELGTYPSNVSDCIKQLEKINFLLRDSGATGRILNRYKLFKDPFLFDQNYVFTKESKATNRAAIQGKGKKAGTTATPMPTRIPKADPYEGQYMGVSLNYLNYYFSSCSASDDLVLFEEHLDGTTTLQNFFYVELDKKTFDAFKDYAKSNSLPFPEIFSPNKPYLFESIDWDYFEQKHGTLPFDIMAE